MRIAQAHVSIGPARPLPRPDATASPHDRPTISDLASPVLQRPVSPLAVGMPPGVHDDWIAQSCEGVATLLDAAGEHGRWQYAIAGSTIGIALGVMGIAEARKDGDGAAMQTALLKVGIGGLGVIAGSGILHGHPAIQAAVEAARAVFGSATPPAKPNVLAHYRGLGLGSANR